MKPADVKPNTYIHLNVEKNEIINLTLGMMLEYWILKFAKGYSQYWSKETFSNKKVINTALPTYGISNYSSDKIAKSFYKKGLKKRIKKNLELKK